MASENVDFSAAPKVVKPKKKYKQQEPEQQEDDEIKLIYNNLMWDKRIVRGNTYSALVTTSKNVEIPYANTSTQKNAPRPEMEDYEETGNRRANIQIFTDQYVETLTDKPPRYEYGAQTDFKMEKQIVRHKMQMKTGTDQDTQIWDNQLFDFDYQVEPLLSVLCARTLEISRMEVLQEQELTIMKNRQLELQLEQEQERKKIREMYAKEEQLEKENAKRLEGFRKQRQQKINTHQRLFSRVLGKQYLRDLEKNTMKYVESQGFFREQLDTDLIEKVLPKFYADSAKEQAQISAWKSQSEELLAAAKELVLKEHKWSKQVEKTRRDKIIAKREELAREKNERKLMKEEEKYMRSFLVEQKIQHEREQEERKKAEEKEEGEEQQAV